MPLLWQLVLEQYEIWTNRLTNIEVRRCFLPLQCLVTASIAQGQNRHWWYSEELDLEDHLHAPNPIENAPNSFCVINNINRYKRTAGASRYVWPVLVWQEIACLLWRRDIHYGEIRTHDFVFLVMLRYTASVVSRGGRLGLWIHINFTRKNAMHCWSCNQLGQS